MNPCGLLYCFFDIAIWYNPTKRFIHSSIPLTLNDKAEPKGKLPTPYWCSGGRFASIVFGESCCNIPTNTIQMLVHI